MKAKELRIGNLMIKLGKQINISIPDLMFIEGGKYAYHYKQILLTEEWLIRFGFRKDKDNVTWHLNQGLWVIQNVGMYLAFGSNKWQIKYVHQLQNLYFALTGQELELR